MIDWDELLNFEKTTDEQLEDGAKMVRDLYMSFVKVGFNDEQALAITISMLSMLNSMIAMIIKEGDL